MSRQRQRQRRHPGDDGLGRRSRRAPDGHVLRLRQIFGLPAAIAALSALGLVAALLDDGWWDRLAWACLLAPVPIGWWAVRRARQGG